MASGSKTRPAQVQERQPGIESEMRPKPRFKRSEYRAAGKLKGKRAIVTGGDSGIGRSVAVHFAMEGANVAIAYLDETEDAAKSKELVEEQGRKCIAFAGDLGDEKTAFTCVAKAVKELGGIDILVNNAAEQHPQDRLEDISAEQLERTFRTNIFSYFFMARAALAYLPDGGTIINTTSVTAYRGSKQLIDYAATKGAIVTFTRSLALSLASRGIRGKRRRTGAYLDPPHPIHVRFRKGRNVWRRRSARSSGGARRGRAGIRVSRRRGLVLHDGADSAPQRRRNHQRIG